MIDRKKKARPVGDATGQAVGTDFAGHVPTTDFITDRKEMRYFSLGVSR